MKIVALVGVKDEVELIGACVKQLWSIGVDLVIVYDDGSTDGTSEVLKSLESKDQLWVVDVGQMPASEGPTTEAFRFRWAQKANADWVLFLDADEFWVPASGSLRECASLETADILTIDRYNVPVTRSGPMVPDQPWSEKYENLFLCVERIPNFYSYLQQHPTVPWILGQPIAPKVMARPHAISTVTAGGHFVDAVSEETARRTVPQDLLIAHLPFTTFARFERKVGNMRNVIRRYPEFFSGEVAWHQRRWASMLEAGNLHEEFDRQVLDDELVSKLVNAGTIRTASTLFDEREKSSRRPVATQWYERLVDDWF